MEEKRNRELVYALLFIAVLGLVVFLFYLIESGKPKESQAISSTPTTVSQIQQDTSMSVGGIAADTTTVLTPQNWYYEENEDKMGAKVKLASVTAAELLTFDFPYNGGSEASFVIRRKGRATNIYLRVSKGQFNTSTYGMTARIRFDSGTPIKYSLSQASDASSDIVFFDSEQAILKKLKRAKKMVVEVEFYSEGLRQIEFDVSNLKWN